MASTELEKRVAQLEKEVARLKARAGNDDEPWWEEIAGIFKDDPLHEEAMKVALAERRRLRSRPRNGRSRHRSAQSHRA